MLRLPKQATRLPQYKPVRARCIATTSYAQSQGMRMARKPIVVPGVSVPNVDATYAALLNDMSMGGRKRRTVLESLPPSGSAPSSPSPTAQAGTDAEAEAEDDDGRRPERRAPAALYGVKHVGQVVLPEKLVEGVTEAIAGAESPKFVRGAYLELLQPKPKTKEKGGYLNMPEHALARAAAFLPGQYAAVYNVLKELKTRLGVVVGPVLEVSFSHGPGFWATHEIFGPEAAKGYTLVHRTRHGLDLAKKLASAVPVQTGSWVRDIAFAEVSNPQIAMSTFELGTLPKVSGRKALLDKLVDTGAEHIILVDRATDESWAAMVEAREYLLSKSTETAPWRITAPCPHEATCPRAEGKEACSFAQQLQRPAFVRKTKHGKRGEEIAPYTYLVMSRGSRPEPVRSDAGRVGGVGYEAALREHQKLEGKSVLQPVEGGDLEQFEPISLATEEPVMPKEDITPEEQGAMAEEAYAWPRLVAPPIKRKGHVVMDACTWQGDIKRFTVSKSQGKQIYHDARKSMWGDLFPHDVKHKMVPRKRGVMKLSEPALPETAVTEEVQATSDVDVGALLKELGMEMPVARLDNVEASNAAEVPMSELAEEPEASSSSGVGRAGRGRRRRDPRNNPSRGFHTSTRPRLTAVGLGLPRTFSSSSPTFSAQPSGPAYKINVQSLQALHDSKTPISVLTAYDYPTSLLCSKSGVDMILVGDSLAQVALGYSSTVPLTMDEIRHHLRAVARGSGSSFLLVDLPFGYMEESVAAGAKAAMQLIKDGADGIKIEGGREIIPLVKRLTDHGVPVMPHIGLQPQRAGTTGYKAQARSATAALDLVAVAKEMEDAGAFALLLEAIPHQVGSAIAQRVGIPTIGIGAGPDTSGQVLVITDMLGYYDFGEEKPKAAKFVREFGGVGKEMGSAVRAYCEAVKQRSYPAKPETYSMTKDEAGEFRRLLEEQ